MKLSIKYPILFSINEDILPKQLLPSNGRTFSIAEIFEFLIVSSDHDDLDRIEIFDGALYLNPVDKIFNKRASKFWFSNSAFFDRDHLSGSVMFIPTRYDPYQGKNKII